MSAPFGVVLELGLNESVKRGVDYYIENMVLALAEVDPVHRYLLFSYFLRDHARKSARLPDPRAANFERLFARFPDSLVLEYDCRRGWPIVDELLLARRDFAVYHVLGGGRLPHLSRGKTVVTYFDLAEETLPQRGGVGDPAKGIGDAASFDRARRADHIVATGEIAKRELTRFYALPESKITVIPTGVDLRRFRPVDDRAERERVRARYGLPARFLMIIGPYEPPHRTNAAYTLRAYASLLKTGVVGDCALAFVGKGGPELDALMKTAVELGVRDRVALPGFVPIEDLPAVYSLAEAVVHPTNAEGFGYGMEPLACGTPFVTSDLPGVLEAVGGVALTVPPKTVEPLAAALSRVLTDAALRREMREKGLARAAAHAYPTIARRLVALYERLAGEP